MEKYKKEEQGKSDKQEKIVRFKCPSNECGIQKGVPSTAKAGFMRPWNSRVLSHGTLLWSVSAQVCASGRHPRQTPLRSYFDLAVLQVPFVSGALQPSSQLPTFYSESQQERCGSVLS